jgi:hypothetical protein
MIPDATRLAYLAPPQRAEFAVASRLLSCLVTESHLCALYIPLSDVSATGFALILLHGPSATSAFRAADIQITDVFALIPFTFHNLMKIQPLNEAIIHSGIYPSELE